MKLINYHNFIDLMNLILRKYTLRDKKYVMKKPLIDMSHKVS